MTAKLAKSNKTNQFNRSGSVHYRVDHTEGGQSAVTLSVDFERAPVPEHTYFADFVEVSRMDAEVMIVFGKIDFPSGKSLRNKIEIIFPFQPFIRGLWRSSRDVHRKVKELLAEKGHTERDRGTISSVTEKVQTMVTSNALIIMSDGQSMMDFFMISTKDMWLKTKNGDPLNMDALVRVYANDYLLARFLDQCDVIASSLVEEMNIVFTGDSDENVESVDI